MPYGKNELSDCRFGTNNPELVTVCKRVFADSEILFDCYILNLKVRF